jgi:hypothetical protein
MANEQVLGERKEHCMLAQTALSVRFPSGVSELTYSAVTPAVGDKLRRGRDEWQVVAVEDGGNELTVVTLGPLDGEPKE